MAHASDDYPFELGAYHQKVATESAIAQLWFNRGCVWGANFHHEEAAHCFEQAAKADPKLQTQEDQTVLQVAEEAYLHSCYV